MEIWVAWIRTSKDWLRWFKRDQYVSQEEAERWIDEYCERHPGSEGLALLYGEHPLKVEQT